MLINFFLLKVALTEMLIDAENSEYPNAPVNPYRKLLGMKLLIHFCAKLNCLLLAFYFLTRTQ